MTKEIVLKGLEKFADAYINDVEIDTISSFSQHRGEVERVLQRLQDANMCAKPYNCKVAMAVVQFIGDNVGKDGIRPRKPLVKAIENFPRSETKKQLRSFLGLVGYYRKFISAFSERELVLTDFTKGRKPTKLEWNKVCEERFRDLKKALQIASVLRPPHWEEPFILQVDASDGGLGAILCQVDKDGEKHPVAYATRKLDLREERLSTTEMECLEIV